MAKKKYTLYLPVPLARKLDQVARDRHGAKSALVEEALLVVFFRYSARFSM
jgi:predicted transcriptional regulator